MLISTSPNMLLGALQKNFLKLNGTAFRCCSTIPRTNLVESSPTRIQRISPFAITTHWANQGSFLASGMQSRIPSRALSVDTILRQSQTSGKQPEASSQPTTGEQKQSDGGEEQVEDETKQAPSKRQLLQRAIRDYGSTVVVFHVGISLVSLGIFYAAVSSGIDVVQLVSYLPYVGEKIAGSSIGAGASTFVIAYAVHKVFAPVRISITLTATPFIVQYLRRKGILKAVATAKK